LASSKSFAVSPPSECVLMVTVTLLLMKFLRALLRSLRQRFGGGAAPA